MRPAMSRIIVLLFLCVVTTGCRAPKPKNGDKLLAHIPTTVGDKWQIASDYGGGVVGKDYLKVVAGEPYVIVNGATGVRPDLNGTRYLCANAKVAVFVEVT